MKKILLIGLIGLSNVHGMDIAMPSTPIAILALNESGQTVDFKVPEIQVKRLIFDECGKATKINEDHRSELR